MEHKEALKVIKTVADFYQYFTVTEEKVIEWAKVIEPYEYAFVMANLKEHIKRSEFPPTIKDLTQEKEAASKNVAYTLFTEEAKKDREKQSRELLKELGQEIDIENVEVPEFLKGRQRGERKNDGVTNAE